MIKKNHISSNEEVERMLETGSLRASVDGLPLLRLEHDIDVPGGHLRVYEHVSREAWARTPRRAVLLLPGPIATADFFHIPVAGYDAATPLLRAGFICLTVDLLGTGNSSRPSDGRTATMATQTRALAQAIRVIATTRGLARLDLVGESWGGAIASQLAADPEHVHSVVLVSTLYRTSTPAVDAAARDPRWRALLDGLPDGYLPVGPPIWEPLVARLPPAVAQWTLSHQVGIYPSAPMYAVLTLPYFDPGEARVPGLIIRGEEDDRQGADDARELAKRFGLAGASLVTIAGAGHIPRVEANGRDAFWSEVLAFFA